MGRGVLPPGRQDWCKPPLAPPPYARTFRHMALLELDRIAKPAAPAADAGRGWTAVVGHDGSDADAATLAGAARRASHAGYLIVVHALPLGVSPAAFDGELYASAVRAVLGSIERGLPDGVSHETRIVAGPASLALVEAARRYRADEIVVGISPWRAGRGSLGPVASSLLSLSERPVTIVTRGRS